VARQVSVGLAGGVALEAAARPAIELVMDGQDVGPDGLWLPGDGLGQALAKSVNGNPGTA
jgi:hypothetical protein